MSENPEAFDALRKAVYPFVNEKGKDAEALKRFCEDFMRRRREIGSIRDMTEQEERHLVHDVVTWTMNRYNIPRYRPKRSREERAGFFLLAPEALAISGELDGKASVRGAARVTGQSKSTVGRHLVRQGISPRRDVKVRKLSKTGQRLLGILDATFDRRSAGIIQLHRLTSALWDGNELSVVPTTTQASRTKKLKTVLSEVSSAGLGYNILAIDNVCCVHRGRRFPSMSEAVTWTDEQKRLNRYLSILFPTSPAEPAQDYFWSDPYVVDVMAIIDMSDSGHFYPFEKLRPIFRFERLLLDTQPILPWVERAYRSYSGNRMHENLADLAEMITDPDVRSATRRLAKLLGNLKSFVGDFSSCFDAFQMVDFVLGVMDKTAEASPKSFARLAYLRDWFESSGEYYDDVRDRLANMLQLEKTGEWCAPSDELLAQYLPTQTGSLENETLSEIS